MLFSGDVGPRVTYLVFILVDISWSVCVDIKLVVKLPTCFLLSSCFNVGRSLYLFNITCDCEGRASFFFVKAFRKMLPKVGGGGEMAFLTLGKGEELLCEPIMYMWRGGKGEGGG